MAAFLVAASIILFVLALFHFVYESIIGPSIHVALRYHLFALRDRLRREKYLHHDEIDPRVFRHLEDSVNASIRFLPTLDLAGFRAFANAYERDMELRERLRRRMDILNDCPVKSIEALRADHYRIAVKAAVTNNFCLLLYILPVFYVIHHFQKIRAALKALFFVSEGEMDRIIGHRRATAV